MYVSKKYIGLTEIAGLDIDGRTKLNNACMFAKAVVSLTWFVVNYALQLNYSKPFSALSEYGTRNPKVIWEEPRRRPARTEWTLLLRVLLAVQCLLQTSQPRIR